MSRSNIALATTCVC